jgi:hypothetical protein
MAIGRLNAVCKPSESLKRRLGALYGERAVQKMDNVLDDVEAIDSLALAIRKSCELRATKDGRVDYRDVAADIIAEMRAHQL